MIEFDNVSRKYGSTLAVDRLSLTLPRGELFALLGPNGAGKTTTIRMLTGLLRPDTGSVRICGFSPTDRDRKANSLMGYVPDEPYLYDKLTGREILEFAGEMHGLDRLTLRDRIERECVRFELSKFIDDLTESYSHGMRQRMVFASALLHDPAVLVVDEPMVGLDPYNARVVKDLLRNQAAAGCTVLMSTHTLAVAEEIADRIGILHRGRLQFLGTVAGLQSELESPHKALEPLFLQMTEERG